MKVAGIVYLQDITQTRMVRGLLKSQKVFENLCGKKSMSSVTLVTTKWGISFSEHEKFRRREDELKEKYWKDMIASGAKVVRFKSEDKAEAEGIFHRIVLEYHQSAKLRIQKEMVDRNRRLPETKAAAILREDLREEIARRKEALTQALREENQFLQDQLDDLPEGFASRIRRALFRNS